MYIASRNRDDDERRVVVTGMGIVTTAGGNLPQYFESLVAGRSGITCWKQLDPRCAGKVGGDLGDFRAPAYMERAGYPIDYVERAKKILLSTPLPAHLTVGAAIQAFFDAGLPDSRLVPERFGHVLGGTNLNAGYIVTNAQTFTEEPDFIEPLYGAINFDTDILAKVSELLTLKGPSWSVGNACGSGNLAIMNGLDLIRTGRADAVVVSATSVGFDPVLIHSWAMINAIAWNSFDDEPWRASRPFDAHRQGFVPSEGAGALVLEPLAGARARGAQIHAEILGAGSASDASRLTRAHADGQVRAMRAALEDARLNPDQVDYINAHATSTIQGDSVEVEAIKRAFGDRAYRIPVNATKSMIGHCTMAAGVVELVATILQMQHGVLHPTINLDEPDPELDLDFVPNQAREYDSKIAISNSFGFGGLNTAVVVARAS